jgi:hypothetical protein
LLSRPPIAKAPFDNKGSFRSHGCVLGLEKKTFKKNEGPMGVVDRYLWLLGEMTTIAMAIVASLLMSDHKSYV